ncbi:MAG TPA: hypothetical protein VE465_01915 [Streptosporangiaceae bacterium]|nr:hypothetical protein [Streptosporangiaceae bacterium]
MTQDADRRERSSSPPPTPVDDQTRRFNEYLVEVIEELTGYHVRMSHLGFWCADRVSPITELEEQEGVKRTLQSVEPKDLVEQIHAQARITQRIAMRDAARI